MYKITFNLKTSICFIDLPLFDGLISYCFCRHELGSFKRDLSLTKEQLNELELLLDKMPLKKHKDGYFLGSFMQFENSLNWTGSWKKRWNNKHDFIADFGKSKRQIEIDKGSFKSYDMPLNLNSIYQVWFYFDSDNVDFVEKLINSYLFGIGKKTSQGYGEIDNFIIDKIDYNPFEKVIRPIPISKNLTENERINLMINNQIANMRIKPPYWIFDDMQLCLVR